MTQGEVKCFSVPEVHCTDIQHITLPHWGGKKKKRKQKIEIVVYTNDSAVVGSGFLKLLNGRKSQQERNRIKIDQTENTKKLN